MFHLSMRARFLSLSITQPSTEEYYKQERGETSNLIQVILSLSLSLSLYLYIYIWLGRKSLIWYKNSYNWESSFE